MTWGVLLFVVLENEKTNITGIVDDSTWHDLFLWEILGLLLWGLLIRIKLSCEEQFKLKN